MKISLAFISILNVSKHINMRAFKSVIFLWEMKIIKKISYLFCIFSLTVCLVQQNSNSTNWVLKAAK